MMAIASSVPARRISPRVPASALCSEHSDQGERHGVILDFSETGLRVQRPLGGPRTRDLQLEFEIPGVDEIMWAKGIICFDQLWCVSPTSVGELSGLLRTSGIELVAAAERHKRLLREYVNDTWRAVHVNDDQEWMYRAACYMRG